MLGTQAKTGSSGSRTPGAHHGPWRRSDCSCRLTSALASLPAR